MFFWVIAFTYSEDVVDAINDVTDAIGEPRLPGWVWVWVPLALDAVLILASWPLKRRIAKSDGDSGRLWGWWISGALLTVAVHLMWILTEPHRVNLATVWLHLLASFLFVIAMGILLTSALNADPITLFSLQLRDAHPRDWIRAHSTLPLIVGTFFGYVATPLWYPKILLHSSPIGSSGDQGCPPVIDPQYFAQMTQVIPLLLITLGIEFNYIRQAQAVQEPVQRAAPILTVILLCIAEGLAFSALMKKDACGLGAAWNEYIALVVTVQAAAIGLATFVWLLLTSERRS
ncbi:MAG: hypothetical protein JO330_09850 [Mycobacteriaceae bacterium]|nr:hypothetical protein [Mycobacteriaceae bacterium]